jgi:glycogen synthase
MRILFATPEASDFVQVGGLAAVSSALPRALRDSPISGSSFPDIHPFFEA